VRWLPPPAASLLGDPDAFGGGGYPEPVPSAVEVGLVRGAHLAGGVLGASARDSTATREPEPAPTILVLRLDALLT